MEKQTKLHTIAKHSTTILPCLISFILLLLLSNGSVYCNAFTSTTKLSLFSIRSYTQQNKKSNKQQSLKMAGFPPPMGPGPGGPMRDGPPPPMGQRSFGGPDGMGPPPMGDGALFVVVIQKFYCVIIVVSFCVGYGSLV